MYKKLIVFEMYIKLMYIKLMLYRFAMEEHIFNRHVNFTIIEQIRKNTFSRETRNKSLK